MNKLLLLCFSIALFSSCGNKDSYSVDKDKKYENSKATLEETEKKTPASFLRVEGDKKKNIIGQTVVRGKIFNNAKVVTYKDVTLKLSFYSKTGAVLEEDVEVVYETVTPGGTATFKSKYFTPKGTDSVGMKVVSAKF